MNIYCFLNRCREEIDFPRSILINSYLSKPAGELKSKTKRTISFQDCYCTTLAFRVQMLNWTLLQLGLRLQLSVSNCLVRLFGHSSQEEERRSRLRRRILDYLPSEVKLFTNWVCYLLCLLAFLHASSPRLNLPVYSCLRVLQTQQEMPFSPFLIFQPKFKKIKDMA